MPDARHFTRAVPRMRGFRNAIRVRRQARRRALVAAVIAVIRLILPTRHPASDEGRRPEPPHPNDEDLLDEFLRGHERGHRLGLRLGHESGYRQGLADGFARGLALGQERAYQAGYLDGAGDASD